jgi:2-haloalkanoic acid dehalogenase type II
MSDKTWHDGLKAIAFDVQGTCADFYQPVLRAGDAINRSKGLAIDWAEVSAEWRSIYRTTLDEVIAGKRPWMRVDAIYREALDVLLKRHGLSFTQQERDELNAVWSRLDPWPDAVEGLTRLRRHFTITTLSNAGMAAVVAIVKLQARARGLPARRGLSGLPAGSNPDGRLSQIRSEGGQDVRHAHGLCRAASRVRPRRAAGHRTRELIRLLCG